MQKDEIVELKIDSLGFNGEGVARSGNMVVFVPNALPNETIEAKIVDVKKNFARAKVLKILTSSKQRLQPHCPYFGKCGGCDLQHMTEECALEFKRNKVEQNLKKIAKQNVEVLPCVSGDFQFGYRNKVAFPVCAEGVGMFCAGTNDIIKIDNCLLAEKWAKDLIHIFDEWFLTSGLLCWNRKTGLGLVRHLVARYENNQLLCCVCINGNKLPNVAALAHKLGEKFDSFGLFVNKNNSKNTEILSKQYEHIAGIKEIILEKFGLKYGVSIGSFEQVNPEVSEKIYRQVCSEISGERVVNAYSGAGLLSGILAKNAQRVIGIELDKSAHQNSEDLKKRNQITNLTNICGDCAVELSNVGEFDAIVIDPPRAGCDKKVIETINAVKPKKIVYISCDSATLARDLSYLSVYKIKSVTPYDMFAQTKHVETVCVVERI